MTSILKKYRRYSRRRDDVAAESHQRLDLQGLRMVAMLTVFANHLWGWPAGGFVGVDVFFVISGFLITGNLLRSAEVRGNVRFRTFYWNRVRRIVPAATVVLILTYLVSTWVLKPFKAHEVGLDALFAFIFMSNWRFAAKGTDYFNADGAPSPIQHYWSLSIEEQFYFVWPALIFVISLVVLRKAWPHQRRMQLAGGVMGLVTAISLAWALHESVSWPARAYFDTFTRVWELGVGALLATAVGALARIPAQVKVVLSWTGLAAIVASNALITDQAVGFPAPWALLPVAGSALVIAAGVAGEPAYQPFLRNPLSTYLGDISYSLYLVHWPVIILLADLMGRSPAYYSAATALTLGLAIASFHFVENPLRRIDMTKIRTRVRALQRQRFEIRRSTQLAAITASALLVVAMTAYALRPDTYRHALVPNDIPAVASIDNPLAPSDRPRASELRAEITAAIKTTAWPQFNPSVEAVVKGPITTPEVDECGGAKLLDPGDCTWGSASAPTRVVVIGDSVALSYLGPLRQMALNSNGELQVHSEAQYACFFIEQTVPFKEQKLVDSCARRKPVAVDYINRTKPDVVIISHFYGTKKLADGESLTAQGWADSLQKFIDQFRSSTKKIVFIAPPPDGVSIDACYGQKSNTPPDCISKISHTWKSTAVAEQQLARAVNGVWVDSLPWFCYDERRCPSFVGNILTKRDDVHMTLSYGEKILPVIQESLVASGVIGPPASR